MNAVIDRCAGMTVPVSLVDPRAADQPLVFVNRAFEDLTGYTNDMVVGMNCRFLQGSGTNAEDVRDIARAVAADEPISKVLVNYRRDGSEFYNLLSISPIVFAPGECLLLGCQARFDEYKMLPTAAVSENSDVAPARVSTPRAKALTLQYRALQQQSKTVAMTLRSHLVNSRLILQA